MIARVHIQLPFTIYIPDGIRFEAIKIEADGIPLVFHVPQTGLEDPEPTMKVNVDGHSASGARYIWIDFIGHEFERSNGVAATPTETQIEDVANWFLARLRFITNSPSIGSIELARCNWQLDYLDDSERRLDEVQGLTNTRCNQHVRISVTTLDQSIWGLIGSIPIEFVPPVWNDLLLDARAFEHHPGTAIVLTWTAIEVYIESVLDRLAKEQDVDRTLWTWINRSNGPPIHDEYGPLLKWLLGKSLKENRDLWKIFNDLRKARNSFIHGGVARTSKEAGPLDAEQARHLIKEARKIIDFVESSLPESLQLKRYPIRLETRVEKTETSYPRNFVRRGKD